MIVVLSVIPCRKKALRTCAYQEVRNACVSEILACFNFLKHPVWDSPFCLITDEL